MDGSPSPAPPAPPTSVQEPVKQKTNKPTLIIILIVFIILATFGGFLIGKSSNKPKTQTPALSQSNEISVPKDATVTAECVEGRGKQYILPKDIPEGPIYDIHDGRVVALEFLVNFDEVRKMPEKFKELGLKNVKYDHLTIMPVDPHAGFNEKHVHVIAAMMTAGEMNAIMCNGQSTETTHMH